MNEETGASRRPAGPRRAAAVAILAGIALLAAACGGSHAAGSGASPGQRSVQKMAVFAQCMRSHGQPNFYISRAGSSPGSTGPVLTFMGYTVAGVDPNSAQFAAAMKACSHLLPAATGTVTQQQLRRELKSAACMRAHGYPAYPDPRVQNGGDWQQALPASIDTSSPQFQAAAKACGAGGGGG
jgi:hypothetical protein